jgi:hypothetical protein
MEEIRSKRCFVGSAAREMEANKKYTVITTWTKHGLDRLTIGLQAICGNVPDCPTVFVVYGEFTHQQISDVLGDAYFRRKVIVGKENLDKFLSAPIP